MTACTGSLSTSDYASDKGIEQLVSATQDNSDPTLSWDHTGDGRSHNFTIDSVMRTESIGTVILKWDGSIISSDDETETIKNSPLGNFELVNIEVNQQPDQYVTLYFSDPVSKTQINKTQNLNGLIYLKSGHDLRFKIDGNEIKAYPTSRYAYTHIIR